MAKLLQAFINSEKAGGLVLIGCTLVSLVVANSSLGHGYHNFWQSTLFTQSIEYWINDGLMAVFFLLIGLELKQEIIAGKLSNIKAAALPIFAAVGGMLVPAAIYIAINYNTPTQAGAGIPMATDIAFALAILSLLGMRVPVALKVFLTALAVIDDLGAIVVIAIFYTHTIIWAKLGIALGIFCLLLVLNKCKIKNLIPFVTGGIVMWYFMLHSGVHATITGVLLAITIPYGNHKKAGLLVLQNFLHKPVAFIILPLFALANTAISFNVNITELVTTKYSVGIALGLLLGKPIGIFSGIYFAVAAGICKLPPGVNKTSIFGVGILGGIGFTMSIFITLLAFNDEYLINNVKLVIVITSAIAAIIGYIFLRITLPKARCRNVAE